MPSHNKRCSTSGSVSSAEVERVRQMLAKMQGQSVGDSPAEVSDFAEAARDTHCQSAAEDERDCGIGTCSGKAQKSAIDLRALELGPVQAWAVIPDTQSGTAFSPACRDCLVSWTVGEEHSRSKQVPRLVARKFGAKQRAFDSERAFLNALDELEHSCAWERVITLLKGRERSSADVEARLISDGYSQPCAHEAVQRALRCHLVDDTRFASVYVHAKARAGWGRERVERELARAGVSEAQIRETLSSDLPVGRERERAQQVIARRRVPERNPVPKLARFLVGRGFTPEVSLSVAREYVQGMNESEIL